MKYFDEDGYFMGSNLDSATGLIEDENYSGKLFAQIDMEEPLDVSVEFAREWAIEYNLGMGVIESIPFLRRWFS